MIQFKFHGFAITLHCEEFKETKASFGVVPIEKSSKKKRNNSKSWSSAVSVSPHSCFSLCVCVCVSVLEKRAFSLTRQKPVPSNFFCVSLREDQK